MPFELKGKTLRIHGSIGMFVIAPDGLETVVSAVKRADEAMYPAKFAGPSRTRVYEGADYSRRSKNQMHFHALGAIHRHREGIIRRCHFVGMG